MKKALALGLVCTLFLTGCGGKKLTCTMSETEDGMTGERKVVLTFDKEGKEIQKGTVTMNIKIDEEYASYLGLLVASVESVYEDIKDFADVEVKSSDDSISTKVSYKVDGLTEEQLDKLDIASVYKDTTYEETKEQFEDMGFTCK